MTMSKNEKDYNLAEKNTVDELIPWFVNGSLSETEMNAVNNEITDSPQFSEQVDDDLKLAEKVNRESAEVKKLLAMQPAALAKLKKQINYSENKKTWYELALSYFTPKPIFALAISSVAAIFVVGYYPFATDRDMQTGPQTEYQQEYQTLTTAPVNQEGVVLQIIFKPETTEIEMRSLLLESEGKLLSGPTTSGVYRLEIAEDGNKDAELDLFRNHSAVQWFEIEAR